MPPKGYKTLTLSDEVNELVSRAKSIFRKPKIKLLREAMIEYINHHYEYGTVVIDSGKPDIAPTAWSAGIFEALGVAYRQSISGGEISLDVTVRDHGIASRLARIWGGVINEEHPQSDGQPTTRLWTWQVRSHAARRFLELVSPHLQGAKKSVVRELLSTEEKSDQGPQSASAQKEIGSGGSTFRS